jgi:hypothetical protein
MLFIALFHDWIIVSIKQTREACAAHDTNEVELYLRGEPAVAF